MDEKDKNRRAEGERNSFVMPLPPKVDQIKGILGKKKLKEFLEQWRDEDMCRVIISKDIFEIAKKTPVENALKQTVREIRTNSSKLQSSSWRWKARKHFPISKKSSKTFMRECNIKKNQMYRFFMFLADSLLPADFLGARNDELLCKWLTDYVYVVQKDHYWQKYPNLMTRRLLPCRRMKCPQFKEALKKFPLSLDDAMKQSTLVITAFTSKLLLAVGLLFLHSIVQFNTYTMTEKVTFYSGSVFKYWIRKELKKFKKDYALKKIEPIKEDSDTCRVKVRGLRNSIRPLCLFRKTSDFYVTNELKFLNSAMDFFIQLYKEPRYEDSVFECVGMMDDTAKCRTQSLLVNNYLSWIRKYCNDQKFYFITCDVAQCFSTVNRGKLHELLIKVVGDKKCAVGRIEIPLQYGKTNYCFINGDDEYEVRSKLEKYLILQKNSREQIAHIMKELEIRRYNNLIVEDIMHHVRNLKFQIGGKLPSTFQMGKGVPQGYTLSQRLAHIYLLNFDKEYILPHLHKGSMLFRFVDDYFIIANNKKVAQKVLEVVSSADNDYGIRFKRDKIKVSFSNRQYKYGKMLNWCGQTINTTKFEIWKPTAATVRSKARKRTKTKMNKQMSVIGFKSFFGDSL